MAVENLFTNPRLKGDGTWAEVARNLFTNPRMEATSDTVEVRRNLCVNPYSTPGGGSIGIPNGPNPTLSRSASLPIPTPDGRTTGLRGSIVSGSSPTELLLSVYNLDGLSNTSGVERSAGAWFMATAPGYSARFRASASVALEPNEWKWVTADAPIAGDAYTSAYIEKLGGTAGASDTGYVTGVTVVAGNIPPEAPFDGDTELDPAEGLTASWTGAENHSESILSGLGVADTRVGTGGSARAFSIQKTDSDGEKYLHFENPVVAGTWRYLMLAEGSFQGYSVGTKVTALIRARSNQSTSFSFRLATASASAYSSTAPLNLTPEWSWSRLTIEVTSVPTSGVGVYLTLQNVAGQYLDISDLLIVEGEYTGPYFDGSTTPETAGGVVQPEDFRWRWLGEPNASESVMEIERVRGLEEVFAVAGVSTREGRPAVRVIPTGASLSSGFNFPIPAGLHASGRTLIADVHTDKELVGPIMARLSLATANPQTYTAAPGSGPGTYSLRHFSSDVLTSRYVARAWHGSDEGESWWTDIGLFAGEYNGPYGDGSMRGWYWAGEPDNSVSIKAPRPNPDHRRKMYFGVPGAMTWVPCPQIERPSGLTQWQEEVPLLNGGLHVRRSYGGHRVFEMTWNGISVEEAQLLEAYASGVYGDGLIYWLDPMMADKNVLPIWWSAPAMGALGAPSLGAGGSKPLLDDGLSAGPDYLQPRHSAYFDFRAGRGRALWLPVPKGYSLWVYHRANTTGSAGLWVSTEVPSGNGEWHPEEIPPLGASNHGVPSFYEYRPDQGFGGVGAQILYRTDGEPWAGTVEVRDMGAQILPLGIEPEQDTPYVAGMGAAGCVVTEFEKTDMSAAFNKVNVTMVLKEVGPWR